MLFYWKCLVHFDWHFSIVNNWILAKKDEQQKIFFQSDTFKMKPRHVDEKCFLARTFWFMISGLILWSEKFPPKFVFLEIQASPPPNKKLSCSSRCWDRRAMRTVTHHQRPAEAATPGSAHLHDNVSRDFPFLYNQKLPKETTLLPIDIRHLTLNWPKPLLWGKTFQILIVYDFPRPNQTNTSVMYSLLFFSDDTNLYSLFRRAVLIFVR